MVVLEPDDAGTLFFFFFFFFFFFLAVPPPLPDTENAVSIRMPAACCDRAESRFSGRQGRPGRAGGSSRVRRA